MRARRRGRYGLDGDFEHASAPVQAAGLTALGLGLAAVALHGARRRRPEQTALAGLPALFLAGTMVSYLQATRRGKFAVWEDLLDSLDLRGDERVLDLGCGRGAVLLAAARRVPRGLAVGVDLWRADQSGNGVAATLANAAVEGVADRTRVVTADMTSLPFADGSFDVVVSSLAVHNVPGVAGRRSAMTEAIRVLRPGGRLRVVDLAFTRDHAATARGAGWQDVERRSAGPRLWFGGPWFRAWIVAGTRPG